MKKTMSSWLDKQLEAKRKWDVLCYKEWADSSFNQDWGDAHEDYNQEENFSSVRSNSAFQEAAASTFLGMALFMSALIPPIKRPNTFPLLLPDEVSSVIVGHRQDQQILSAKRIESVSQNQSVASSTPKILSYSCWTQEMRDVWPEFDDFRDLLWKKCSTCKTPSNNKLQIEEVISFRACDVNSIVGKLNRIHNKFRNMDQEPSTSRPSKRTVNYKDLSETFREQRNSMETTCSNYKKLDPTSKESKKLFEELKQLRVDSLHMLEDNGYKVSVCNGKKLKKGKPKNFFS